jgi:hypothetical protein
VQLDAACKEREGKERKKEYRSECLVASASICLTVRRIRAVVARNQMQPGKERIPQKEKVSVW